MTIGRSWPSGFAAQLELPYRYTGGGVLDDCDRQLARLLRPAGRRTRAACRRIESASPTRATARCCSTSIRLQPDSATSPLDFGRSLRSTTPSAAALWLSIKLPSGDADRFTGSGATDVSLAIAGEHRLGERLVGRSDRRPSRGSARASALPTQQHDVVWSGARRSRLARVARTGAEGAARCTQRGVRRSRSRFPRRRAGAHRRRRLSLRIRLAVRLSQSARTSLSRARPTSSSCSG